MFCKWCGNNIQLKNKKCPTCGRVTPPMSDCGGFYDLKHSNNISPAPASSNSAVPPQCPIVEKMEPKYAKDREASRKHHMITMLCFAIILLAIILTAVFTLITNSKLGAIEEQIGNLKKSTAAPREETDKDEPPEETTAEPTETPESTEPVEKLPYNFTAEVSLTNANDITIDTDYDFGDYAKSTEVKTAIKEEENGRGISASFTVDENTAADLILMYSQEQYGDTVVGIRCESDLPFFENQDFTYEWQYCKGLDSWTSVDQDIVSQSDEGYWNIVCQSDWLRSISFMKQPVKLRCNIKINNDSGDSMLITLSGICVETDGMIVFDDQ